MGIITEKFPGIAQGVPGGGFAITSFDAVIAWARSNSIWPLWFATSCCGIDAMMCTGASRHDWSRFGFEVSRGSPRQADLLLIAGTINRKMGKVLMRLYEQMAEPRYVVAVGSCNITGGPFKHWSYSVVRGADNLLPVDVYVPGCPPRPEGMLYGMMTLQKLIREGETIKHPGRRVKPVTAVLPPGITREDILKEMEELLLQNATYNVNKKG